MSSLIDAWPQAALFSFPSPPLNHPQLVSHHTGTHIYFTNQCFSLPSPSTSNLFPLLTQALGGLFVGLPQACPVQQSYDILSNLSPRRVQGRDGRPVPRGTLPMGREGFPAPPRAVGRGVQLHLMQCKLRFPLLQHIISISTHNMFPASAPPSSADFDPFPALPRTVGKGGFPAPPRPAKRIKTAGK